MKRSRASFLAEPHTPEMVRPRIANALQARKIMTNPH